MLPAVKRGKISSKIFQLRRHIFPQNHSFSRRIKADFPQSQAISSLFKSFKPWRSGFLILHEYSQLSSAILGFEGTEAFVFNKGSLFVLCACICWGVENNCTRSISDKSSEEIVLVKGIFSGIGSILIAFIVGEKPPEITYMLAAMLLGFVSYGLSINFYIMAQKNLGAAKTSAFYSVAPFLGVGFSFIILGERPTFQFYIALGIMIISTLLMIKDTLGNEKLYNGYVHIHQHKHGRIVHTHEHRHFVYNPMHIHNHSHAG